MWTSFRDHLLQWYPVIFREFPVFFTTGAGLTRRRSYLTLRLWTARQKDSEIFPQRIELFFIDPQLVFEFSDFIFAHEADHEQCCHPKQHRLPTGSGLVTDCFHENPVSNGRVSLFQGATSQEASSPFVTVFTTKKTVRNEATTAKQRMSREIRVRSAFPRSVN